MPIAESMAPGGRPQQARDILRMENITKVYPNGFVANKHVSLSVHAGEIHALCGENGAGKSTLMKILFGEETLEDGKIYLDHKEVTISSPIKAIEMGIGMVHQHFMLVPSLTVAENMVLGMEPTKGCFISMAQAVQMTREVSEKYNLPIDPKAKVRDLPVGLKQRVEILKTLLRGVRILILDEPTAVLTPQETREIFAELKHLREMGHTVIFISHKLNEIKELCDRVTIMRDGRTVAVRNVAEVTEKDISQMMVGRDVMLEVDKPPTAPGKTILKVRHLFANDHFGNRLLKDISFDVRSGEILGVAGIEGNGQNELSEILTGLRKYRDGVVEIDGQNIAGYSVHKIRQLGTGSVPQDRMTYGVVASESIRENLIGNRYDLPEFNKGPFLDIPKTRQCADELIRDYRIKCDDREQPVTMLSGGNIQKVVVAREFSTHPKLVIVNQPTRGIDVGASELVHHKMIELREQGAATLLISADLTEIMEMSDSIIVLQDGQICAYIPDVKAVTMEELGEYMLGIRKMSGEEIGGVMHEQQEH